MEVERLQNEDRSYSSGLGELSITGVDGPVELFDPNHRSLLDRNLGSARVIAFGGNVERVEFDGSRMQTNREDRIAAYGNFRGTVTSDGGYQFSGSADSLWQNDRRVNSTRWERAPTEIQATFLGGFGIMLVFLFRLIVVSIPKLKGDEDILAGFGVR